MGRRHKTLFKPSLKHNCFANAKDTVFGFKLELPESHTSEDRLPIVFVADPKELAALYSKQSFAGEYEEWLKRAVEAEELQAKNALAEIAKQTEEDFKKTYAKKLDAAIEKKIFSFFGCKNLPDAKEASTDE